MEEIHNVINYQFILEKTLNWHVQKIILFQITNYQKTSQKDKESKKRNVKVKRFFKLMNKENKLGSVKSQIDGHSFVFYLFLSSFICCGQQQRQQQQQQQLFCRSEDLESCLKLPLPHFFKEFEIFFEGKIFVQRNIEIQLMF